MPVQPILITYPQSRGQPSLSWETIEGPRHLFLVLSSLFHSACIVELPLYIPLQEEKADPVLFARNVRQYMVCPAAMDCRKHAKNLYMIALLDLATSSSSLLHLPFDMQSRAAPVHAFRRVQARIFAEGEGDRVL